MARQLSKKRRGFVNDVADGLTPTEAAVRNYEVKDRNVAKSVGSELLTFPNVIEELKKLGFDSNNAKRVVGMILNSDDAEHRDRLKAAEQVFKVNSDYAPEKHLVGTVDITPAEDVVQLAHELVTLQRKADSGD